MICFANIMNWIEIDEVFSIMHGYMQKINFQMLFV